MNEFFYKGKSILVIGGTGSVGRRIVDMLLECRPKVIRIFSRDEYKQFIMQQELAGREDTIRYFIGDVRDYERLIRASRDVDIIFHLAALKQVPACEYDPFEAVKTNVIGTQNVIRCAVENGVERVVFTSSDKAISPTNVMGATKLLAERLIASTNYSQGNAKTAFCAVRFGNIMGSRGSVIPLFKKQILEQNKITITDGQMTRFMMSMTDAAKLTMKAVSIAKGGEIFVLKMPVMKLQDLGDVVIEEVCEKYSIDRDSVKVEYIGLRPGEKYYEELMSREEAENAYELNDMYIIEPFQKTYSYLSYEGAKPASGSSYSSSNARIICKDKIKQIIKNEGLI